MEEACARTASETDAIAQRLDSVWQGVETKPARRRFVVVDRAEDAAMMRQAAGTLIFDTQGQGLVEITREVSRWVGGQGMTTGLLTLFCRHTSASLLIQENAAPEVRTDLEAFFARLAPEDRRLYAHDDEGPDDMPAHIRAALTGVSLQVPLMDGRLALGTWQGVYLFEHRRAPHHRQVACLLQGQ